MRMPMLVELVNGWGTVPRAKAGDRDRPPVAEFAGGGFTDAALERVADRLYPVFEHRIGEPPAGRGRRPSPAGRFPSR